MRRTAASVIFAATAWATSLAAAEATFYSLPASVVEVVTMPAHLETFTRPVGAEVERLLGATPPPEGDRLGLLLAMRVHLSLLTGNTERALETAARIRERQPTAMDRAFAGLTTQAAVAAQRAAKPGTGEWIAAFRRELARAFATMPSSAEGVAMLEKQRERIHATTREALMADAARLGAKLDATGRCTLEDADQIIRIGHRLENILPLRVTMLAVFDEAIAARKSASR